MQGTTENISAARAVQVCRGTVRLLAKSLEFAVKLVARFEDLFLSIMGTKSGVSSRELTLFIGFRLDEYRNRLHEPLMATPKEPRRTTAHSKMGVLRKYHWTTVMYHYDETDFVRADIQLKMILCCVLSHRKYLEKHV